MTGTSTLSDVRKSIHPQNDDTWATIAARELSSEPEEQAVGNLQSWNLHVFMRARMNPQDGNAILPSDVIFIEPPRG